MKKKVLLSLVVLLAMVGAGVVVYDVPAFANKYQCKPCKGKGTITSKCSQCNGKGSWKITCPTCNGKQVVRKPGALFVSGCENCKGAFKTSTGKVEVYCQALGCEKGKVTSKCSTCGGTGWPTS